MKKTLVALAVATVAASASATTVYNNDGTTVDVGGRFDVVLGKFGDNQRADLRNNESRIFIQAEQYFGDGYKAVAYTRLRFNDGGDRWDTGSSFNNIKTNKLWIALEKDNVGRVSFGKQNTSADDVQINDHSYIFGGNNNLFTGGDKVVAFRSANYQLSEGQTLGFGADYAFGQARKGQLYKKIEWNKEKNVYVLEDDNPDLKYAYGTSIFYAGQFGDLGLNLNAGYTVETYDDNIEFSNYTGSKVQSWRVASQVAYGPVNFGAEYGQSYFKNSQRNESQGRGRFLEVAAKYQYLDNASVYAIFERNQYKGSEGGLKFEKNEASFLRSVVGTLKVNNNQTLTENVYLVGADYAFNKNVVAYVEYAHSRVKGTGETAGVKLGTNSQDSVKDNRYGVGLRVYF